MTAGPRHARPAPSPAGGVCVIGLGSRGLAVLERILTLAARPERAAGPLIVDVVDPVGRGSGQHAPTQPDYLLLNTICAEVDQFPADTIAVDRSVDGPTDLYSWVTHRGLRLAEDRVTLGSAGREVRPDDYLPRRILGEYLAWCLDLLLAKTPDHVQVRIHKANAVEITTDDAGQRTVGLDDGTRVPADNIFLTVGHVPGPRATGSPRDERVIADPYPLPAQLERVRAGQTVAISGTGLSAMDVLASLTIGRGGRHTVDADGTPRYLPSGEEPGILLYSRTGLPFRARPQANPTSRYQALVFTVDAVQRLRRETDRCAQLNLHADVLPLLYSEMRIAFHRRCASLTGGPAAEQAMTARLADAARAGGLAAELQQLDAQHVDRFGVLDPADLLFPQLPEFDDAAGYQAWYRAALAADLAEARLGLAASPIKSALEVMRDQREVLRRAVDFTGLDDKSHGEFYGSFTARLNRLVTGPQLDRHQDLLALVDAGVVAVPFGPEPQTAWDEQTSQWTIGSTRLTVAHSHPVDWICQAHAGPGDIARTANPILNQLRESGRIRRHRPQVPEGCGVDVTPAQHPIAADGTADERMWVLGPLCEGATFYNHYVPSPGTPNRALDDAHRCVADLLGTARPDAGPAPRQSPDHLVTPTP